MSDRIKLAITYIGAAYFVMWQVCLMHEVPWETFRKISLCLLILIVPLALFAMAQWSVTNLPPIGWRDEHDGGPGDA